MIQQLFRGIVPESSNIGMIYKLCRSVDQYVDLGADFGEMSNQELFAAINENIFCDIYRERVSGPSGRKPIYPTT
ncbi:MAG: hypothetical protein ABI602_03085 [Candidatus Saccharibacteria bacterium]